MTLHQYRILRSLKMDREKFERKSDSLLRRAARSPYTAGIVVTLFVIVFSAFVLWI